MRLRLRGLLLVLAASLAAAPVARAQPEIVPAEHPVYTFLHAQRTAGVLPEYRHEVRPASRAEIQRLLDALERRERRLGKTARAWLRIYRRELFEPEGEVEAWVSGGRFRLPHGRDTEKFIFHTADSTWRFGAELYGRLAARGARDSLRLSGGALSGDLVLQGSYRNLVGFYTEITNGTAFSGNPRLLLRDPDLEPLYYQQVQPDVGQFDRSTAALRVGTPRLFAEIANARLTMGTGYGDGLILSSRPDYFSFVRAGFATKAVGYTFVHAVLGDRARNVQNERGEGLIVGGNERYLALHRLSVQPIRALSFAFTEMVVYGRRGPELAYLNPVNPFKTSEHALYDRDNSLFSLEVTARPARGVEAYGTILVDDLNLGLLGRHSYNNKFALQGGVGVARGAALAWAEYTRVEPFTYTHRFFEGGSYYNSYTHNGFGLGHPLGPNADQYEAGLRLWGPGRVQATATARYRRRGENYALGDSLVNVGGDVADGRQPSFSERSKRFLSGTRHDGPGGALTLSWEPVRDVALFRFVLDVQQWSGDVDRAFGRLDVRFTL